MAGAPPEGNPDARGPEDGDDVVEEQDDAVEAYWAGESSRSRGFSRPSSGRRGAGGEARRLRSAALAYARRGIAVFPCEPGGKRPLTPNGHQDATTDEGRVRSWWARWPYANVAIPTGRASGLVVLDVDLGAGLESIGELELRHGEPPRTAKARTGGGGEHVYFSYPAGREGPEIRNSQGHLGPGLDVRGEGGYVLVPPSRTIHEYRWVERSRPTAAAWLVGCLDERARMEAGETLF